MTECTKGSLATIVLTTALLFFYYSYQIIHADHLAFGVGGDGYKNYYTLAYFLKNDSGSHFTGMNYPYGENVVFTDNQPAVAWTLKILENVFPAINNHIHAYLIWVIFLSIIISSFYIYKILIEFRVGTVLAMVFAIFIAMMSPQLPRLNAHFALGYTCYLPLLLWLLIRYFNTNGRFIYAVFLFSLITVFTFIHIYYLAFAIFFIIPLIFIFWLVNFREQGKYFRFILGLVLSVILPFIILKIYLLITDPILDRPQSPYGFLAYYSTPADIFLHPYSFTGQIMARFLPPNVLVYHSEGTGYIGLSVILILFSGLVVIIKSGRLAKKLLPDFYPLNYFILPAIMVLLFAMSFPFGIDGFRDHYNQFPMAIKQLRAVGRFNWIFYYVAAITAAVIAWRIFLNFENRRKYSGYVFILLICSIWFLEVHMISSRYEVDFKNNGTEINEQKDAMAFSNTVENTGRSINQFQAILAFPFFLNGSEKIYIESDAGFGAMETSLITGLPIACGSMSRTSLSQTLKMVNLLSGPLVRKKVLADYNNNKPLLLVALNETLSPEEMTLISRSKLLFSLGQKKYYELPLSAFNDSVNDVEKYILTVKASLLHHNGYMSCDTAQNVILRQFENGWKDGEILCEGEHYAKDRVWLYQDTLPASLDSTGYEVSIWMHADQRSAGFPSLCYSQLDSSGREIEQRCAGGKFSTNAYNSCVRTALDFTLYSKRNKVYISSTSDYPNCDEYSDFMIRPKYENVIIDLAGDSVYSFNNYFLQ